ncbi:MAG: MFS transporter [Aureispira sp.]|nr:MFS transporter [Aureispira sp.]
MQSPSHKLLTSNIWKLYLLKVSKWFMLFMPIIVLFYQSNGLSLQEVMTIQAVYSLAVAIFEIPSGYFSDRLGRRNSLMIGSILITIHFIVFSCSYTMGGFMIGAVAGGVGGSFISGTDSALLYDTLTRLKREKEYLKLEGKTYAISTFSEAMAAILGGWLAHQYGLRIPIYGQVGIASMGILVAWSIVEPPSQEVNQQTTWSDILKIVRHAFIDAKLLRWYILIGAWIGAATHLLAWFTQPYLENIDFSEQSIGLLWAGLNLTVAFVAFYAYRIYQVASSKLLLILIIIGLTVGYIILGLYGLEYWGLGLALIFMMYAWRGIATPVLKDLVNQQTPSNMRATVLSLRGFLIRIIYVISAPYLGYIADVFTIEEAFLIMGVIFGIVGIIIVLLISTLKR